MTDQIISQGEIDRFYEKLNREAESGGYHLNPEVEFTKELAKGLITNTNRFGYQACPCRLASGKQENDRDIVCPCDYRDADLTQYGTCYCGLYVSQAILNGEQHIGSIPERRPPIEEREKLKLNKFEGNITSLPLPVWRCKVCGYLCAREEPPESCPICKAKKDRFERFM
jgi:ferredoxin-thioredoxin reductase catalytic subunit